jgi:hypothetical protein
VLALRAAGSGLRFLKGLPPQLSLMFARARMFRAASGLTGFLTFAAPSPRTVWAGARPGGLGSRLRRVAVLFLFATGGGSVKARHWLIFLDAPERSRSPSS